MTTEQKFNCIFCKDVFDSKEELQVHFRKHADPKFKSKNRFGNDPQVSDEKAKEKNEMVSCDVCSQMFPTISKAITHKHKVHPDHDVKYFCPWCGKLFTMKHPYNIHVQTNHEKQEQIDNKIFHCDCCDVDFFLPSAVIYHNKFFHRQDTDIPDFGVSKKLRLYNQEILQLYYCAFCGEEYENKVNLFKHITDDHGDENQSPEEVLRCPLCEAIFYHLDAYEIHLSFHTTDDLYSAQNELFGDLMDFSLETVPPIIEKVETRDDLEAEAHSQDTDGESFVNAVGIEKFLELAMDQTEDSNSGKVKKKKHKKAKKSAITLDEFLSMNQDVFGEDLDFQGVEEVPTRVVAKQIKNKKKSGNTATSAELEKLKQKGIVVMKVGASKPAKNTQKNKATSNRELKTSSEVLTKLINQSNNQIKIMKKPAAAVNKDTIVLKNSTSECNNLSDTNINEDEIEAKDDCEDNMNKKNSDEIKTTTTFTKSDDLPIDNNKNMKDDCSLTPSSTDISSNVTMNKNDKLLHEENDTVDNITKEFNCTSNNNNNLGQPFQVSHPDNSPEKGAIKDTLEYMKTTDDKQINKCQVDENESDSKVVDKNSITYTDSTEGSYEKNEDIQVSIDKNRPVVRSLSSLKHLSHLTVKPVNYIKNIASILPADIVVENINDDIPQANDEKESASLTVSTDKEINSTKPKALVDNDPTLDALKILSKNITIKSLSAPIKRNIEESGSNDDETNVTQTHSNMNLKDISGNKKYTMKKIKFETNEPYLGNKLVNNTNNPVKNVQSNTTNKVNTSPIPEVKLSKIHTDTAQHSPIKTNTHILKHLPNIITKPSTAKINVPPQIVKQSILPVETVKTCRKDQEIIEISDIDDSDNETDNNTKEYEPKQETTKSIDPLKNLSKHITIKSLNQPVQALLPKIKVEKMEDQNDNDDYTHASNSDDDIPKVCSQKLSMRSAAFKNALKNLGKNITVKSRTSSPCQSIKSQDHNSQDSYADKNESNDSDSDTGKVKITELNDDNIDNHENLEDFNDCDEEQGDNKPIVESPHDSCSETDEVDANELLDFESEINATTVLKTNQENITNKNTVCLNNLKNISKNLTIKSLNSSCSDKQEKHKPTQPQENSEVVKNQTKQIIKPSKQLVKDTSNDNTSTNRNLKKIGMVVDHTTNESLNQKVSVNKEVTVKTFQTKTVIQEITTTVTKTIKTVNQTVKQETRNSSQVGIPVLPQRVQGMRPSTSKNLQGVVIRQAAPVAVRANNALTQIRPVATVVRPAKQIVSVRPGLNMTRANTPRMPSSKTNLPKSSPNKQAIGKPLKFSPSVLNSAIVKRPNTEEVSGPFSCFKKPKESLIPVSDVPAFVSNNDATVQVKAASHITSSNYMSTSKTVKGNSVVTATQMKSEVTSMQQLSRLGNTVGIKVKSAQVKQTQVQEKSESSAMKRTTLEAIEKLQKQGLLVKKPRIETNENSDFDHVDDNIGSADEHDE